MASFHSISDVIFGNAQAVPNRLCVADDKTEMTYGEFRDAAVCAAWGLTFAGAGYGDRVLVRCMQDAAFLVMNIACEIVGAVFVPVEKDAGAGNERMIRQETGGILFVGEPHAVPNPGCPCISFQELLEIGAGMGSSALPDKKTADEDRTVQILFTTGTTGKSKGIEMTGPANIAIAENVSEGVDMREGNVELIPLPISHSHGLRCCYANFLRGGTVVLADGMRNIKGMYDQIRRYHVNALDLSPSAAGLMLKMFRKVLPELNEQLEYIQIGTAALPGQLKASLREAFPDARLYNFYGSTESGRSCVLNFNSDEDRPCCVGRPAKNASFMITDEQRRRIDSDAEHTGLIACAGPMNMKGYWKAPGQTAQVMEDGYIFTNDEGYIDGDGFIYVLGRKGDAINYMGIKIAPEEIEEAAAAYPDVADCACAPKPDPAAGQIPCLYLQPKNAASFDRTDFMAFLSGRIDRNKMPRRIEFVEHIPRTSNGKVRRNVLQGLTQETADKI